MPYSARAAQQRRIAADALPYFALADRPYQLIKHGTTTTFRVGLPADRLHVLRLQSQQRMPFDVVQSEVRWLHDLCQQTALRVPEPVRATNGESAVLLPATAKREAQIATMFGWLPGRATRRPTVREAELIGESLALLHLFSQTYRPPAIFKRWPFDSTTFLENAEVLERGDLTIISAAVVERVRAAIRFVQLILSALDAESASYGLIHADTNLTNWLFDADQVALIDFEVCCYGYYVFDIGRVLHELSSDRRQSVSLTSAFYRGYTRIRSLPPLQDVRIQAGVLMSLIDIVTWACALEPWMQQTAWANKLTEKAIVQIEQTMVQLKPTSLR